MLRLTTRFPAKRAFVTGAASGLGEALCRALAQDRWTIGMADFNAERLAETARAIEALGARVLPYSFDVTDRAAYTAAAEAFCAETGGVDLVVNNAGVACGGALGEYPPEDWDWLIGINLTGVYNGCHIFLPWLKEQRGGHIINTASAAAFVPAPRMTAYCTAKAGVRMLSEVLHNELAPLNVGCTVVMPEFFQTNLHESLRGPEVELATKLITRAPYTAEQVALLALDCAGKNRLDAVFGRQARVLWWLRHLSPRLLHRLVRKHDQLQQRWLQQRANRAQRPLAEK